MMYNTGRPSQLVIIMSSEYAQYCNGNSDDDDDNSEDDDDDDH